MGGGGARSAGRWWHSAFVKTQKGIGSPLVPVPRSRSPASPQKSGISQHPRFPPEQETVLKHTGRGPGRTVPRVKSAGAKTKLDETTMIPAVPRRHEPEKREFRNKTLYIQ